MTSNPHDHDQEVLSDFLDGTLPSEEREELEQHLESCGQCREVLGSLRALVEQARGLSTVPPPHDLWPGVAAALMAPLGSVGRTTKVIELPTARGWERGGAGLGGLALTAPQLAAAAAILVVLSASITWAVGPGLEVDDATPAQISSLPVRMTSAALPAPPETLSSDLEALEAAFDAVRFSLDGETVRVLERNLGVIEQAIQDSRRALVQDPANGFLAEHLERAYQRKLTYLRSATEIANWSS